MVVYVCVGGWGGGGLRWWCFCSRIDVDVSDDTRRWDAPEIPVPGIRRVLALPVL